MVRRRPFAALALLATFVFCLQSETQADQHKLRSPFTIQGTVTDHHGNPVSDALVAEGATWGAPRMQTTKTDRQGRYTLDDCRRRNAVLTIIREGLAPELRKVRIEQKVETQDFQLQPPRTLRVRVVDQNERPIPGSLISIPWWRENCTLTKVGIPSRTDAAGRWVWDWAPNEPIELYIISARHACFLTGEITPTKGEHVFTLAPRLRISGRAVDAKTKSPVTRYAMTLSSTAPSGRDPVGDQGYAESIHKNGEFDFTVGGAVRSGLRVLKINAPGYQPAISHPIRDDDGDVTINFMLQRSQSN
jgi:hypothetical protein